MHFQRQSWQTDADKPIFFEILVHKIQRHHCSVIQPFVTFPFGSCRKVCRICQFTELLHKLCIIADLHLHLGRTKLRIIPRCTLPRRYMEIIRIQNLMRRHQEHRLRFQVGNLTCRRVIRLNRFLYFFLLAPADFRYNYRRMRKHKCCFDQRYAPPCTVPFSLLYSQDICNCFLCFAQSDRYRLISVWYGMPDSLLCSLKKSTVSLSMFIVICFFSFFT